MLRIYTKNILEPRLAGVTQYPHALLGITHTSCPLTAQVGQRTPPQIWAFQSFHCYILLK